MTSTRCRRNRRRAHPRRSRSRPCSPASAAPRRAPSPPSSGRSIDDLEERGWLERRKDPADRRRNVVVLTDAGAAKLSEGRAAAFERAKELTAPLSARERRALRDLLAKIA
jgi:DNA-binding MarR family transcriptional regulator